MLFKKKISISVSTIKYHLRILLLTFINSKKTESTESHNIITTVTFTLNYIQIETQILKELSTKAGDKYMVIMSESVSEDELHTEARGLLHRLL